MSYHTEIITPAERVTRCAKHDWAHLLPHSSQLQESKRIEYIAANILRYAHTAYICLKCGKTGHSVYGRRFRVHSDYYSEAIKLEAKNMAIHFGLVEKEPGVYTV